MHYDTVSWRKCSIKRQQTPAIIELNWQPTEMSANHFIPKLFIEHFSAILEEFYFILFLIPDLFISQMASNVELSFVIDLIKPFIKQSSYRWFQ